MNNEESKTPNCSWFFLAYIGSLQKGGDKIFLLPVILKLGVDNKWVTGEALVATLKFMYKERGYVTTRSTTILEKKKKI